jgi:hypothetical protein
MIISDLEHLEDLAEDHGLVGGTSTNRLSYLLSKLNIHSVGRLKTWLKNRNKLSAIDSASLTTYSESDFISALTPANASKVSASSSYKSASA